MSSGPLSPLSPFSTRLSRNSLSNQEVVATKEVTARTPSTTPKSSIKQNAFSALCSPDASSADSLPPVPSPRDRVGSVSDEDEPLVSPKRPAEESPSEKAAETVTETEVTRPPTPPPAEKAQVAKTPKTTSISKDTTVKVVSVKKSAAAPLLVSEKSETVETNPVTSVSSTKSTSSTTKSSSSTTKSSSKSRFGFGGSIPVKSSGYGRSVPMKGPTKSNNSMNNTSMSYASVAKEDDSFEVVLSKKDKKINSNNSNNSNNNNNNNRISTPQSNKKKRGGGTPSSKTPVSSALVRATKSVMSNFRSTPSKKSPLEKKAIGGGFTGQQIGRLPGYLLRFDVEDSGVKKNYDKIFSEGSGLSEKDIKELLNVKLPGKVSFL